MLITNIHKTNHIYKNNKILKIIPILGITGSITLNNNNTLAIGIKPEITNKSTFNNLHIIMKNLVNYINKHNIQDLIITTLDIGEKQLNTYNTTQIMSAYMKLTQVKNLYLVDMNYPLN
jgi:hypothetical protein